VTFCRHRCFRLSLTSTSVSTNRIGALLRLQPGQSQRILGKQDPPKPGPGLKLAADPVVETYAVGDVRGDQRRDAHAWSAILIKLPSSPGTRWPHMIISNYDGRVDDPPRCVDRPIDLPITARARSSSTPMTTRRAA
jgi:hypothetical protein